MHASITSWAPFVGHSEENMPSSWPENRFVVGPAVNNRKMAIKRIPGTSWLKSTNYVNNCNKYNGMHSDITSIPKNIDNNNNSTNDENADSASCITPRTPPMNIPIDSAWLMETLSLDNDMNKKVSDSSVSSGISSCSHKKLSDSSVSSGISSCSHKKSSDSSISSDVSSCCDKKLSDSSISCISLCSDKKQSDSSISSGISTCSDEGFCSGSFYESSCSESFTESWLNSLKENRPRKKSKKKEDGRTRLIDEDGFIRRAAIICVNADHSQVLLVSSKDRESWLIPGGGLEAGEEGAATASREAWEEAGVIGEVLAHLGQVESSHHSGCKKHRTDVYLMEVHEKRDEYPESYLGRDCGWFVFNDAHLLLMRYKPQHAAYLQKYLVTRPQDLT
ncbi:unnamed protein product [Meganyctiphanes norvegica]|uniref:Nudix hydrolase domain-containing protein n=1 Tax=Meganyctiphanes norvegica TaxID=48144 RepID=A0AAV2QUB1_MEGNR